jgi:hypothetical protein
MAAAGRPAAHDAAASESGQAGSPAPTGSRRASFLLGDSLSGGADAPLAAAGGAPGPSFALQAARRGERRRLARFVRLLDCLVSEALRRMVLGSLADMHHALAQVRRACGALLAPSTAQSARGPLGDATAGARVRCAASVFNNPPKPQGDLENELRGLVASHLYSGGDGGAATVAHKGSAPAEAAPAAGAPGQPRAAPVLRLELLLVDAAASSSVPNGGHGPARAGLAFDPPASALLAALATAQRRMAAAARAVPRLLLEPRLQASRAARGLGGWGWGG